MLCRMAACNTVAEAKAMHAVAMGIFDPSKGVYSFLPSPTTPSAEELQALGATPRERDQSVRKAALKCVRQLGNGNKKAFQNLALPMKELVCYYLFGSSGFNAGGFVEELQGVIEKYGTGNTDEAVDGCSYLMEYLDSLEEVPLGAIYKRMLKGLPIKASQGDAIDEVYCDDWPDLAVEGWQEEPLK
jgi:hypothetical protein